MVVICISCVYDGEASVVVWHRYCVILELVSVLCLFCVSVECVDYFSYPSSVVCIESGLYCVLESYLHCGVVVV